MKKLSSNKTKKINPKILDKSLLFYLQQSCVKDKIYTGFTEVDNFTPLKKGELCYIGSKVGFGKTTFLLHLALNSGQNNQNVAYHNVGVDYNTLLKRLLAIQCQIAIKKMELQQTYTIENTKLLNALQDLKKMPFFLQPFQNQESIFVQNIKNFIIQQNVDYLIIDELHYLREKPEEIMSELKKIASQTHSCIITCFNSSNNLTKNNINLEIDKNIKIFADKIFWISPLSITLKDGIVKTDSNFLILKLLQNKNGRIRDVKLKYQKELQKISNYDENMSVFDINRLNELR